VFAAQEGHVMVVAQPVLKNQPESRRSRERSISGRHPAVRCEIIRPQDYAEWNALVDTSPHGTVFHYAWWLEITAERFEILAVRGMDGALLGGIPVPRSRRSGLDLVHSPRLTPYLGPIFDLSSANHTCDRLYLMRSWGEILAREITAFDSFRCIAGASAPDLQGFLWAGYRVQLAYTFRFPAMLPVDCVNKGMTRTHSQNLARAKKLGVTVIKDDNAGVLIGLNKMTFDRQGKEPGHSPELVQRLWAAAYSRGRATIYVAQTPDGIPAAALLAVRDNRTVYQIVSGVNWDLRDSQGGYLVLWQALEDALPNGYAFDFEGSALRGVETYYRRWGPAAVPVWRIEKSRTLRGALLQHLIYRRHAAAINDFAPNAS
jgi:GNAT acetyltransferase-like protein